MEVTVQLGQAAHFCSFEPLTNLLHVHGFQLSDSYAGRTFNIRLTATTLTATYYEEYEASFDLIVAPLRPKASDLQQEAADPSEATDESRVNKQGHPVWTGKLLATTLAEPFDSDKPKPYIAALSESGLLTVGWDAQLRTSPEKSN